MFGLQAKLAALGAGLLALAAFFVRFQAVKNQRDKAVVVAETLRSRHTTQQVQKKIKREEEKKLISRTARIAAELEKDKESFSGVDNLSKPNDF